MTPSLSIQILPRLAPHRAGSAPTVRLSPQAVRTYDIFNTVCANWPDIVSYGTWRNDGEHGEGRAMDIMVSGTTGWAVADFLRANYAALDIEYLIYARNIWSVERAGEGWRGMADRGSITAITWTTCTSRCIECVASACGAGSFDGRLLEFVALLTIRGLSKGQRMVGRSTRTPDRISVRSRPRAAPAVAMRRSATPPTSLPATGPADVATT